jgi:hypothetical protein
VVKSYERNQEILKRIAQFADDERAILATVVDLQRFGLSARGRADAD